MSGVDSRTCWLISAWFWVVIAPISSDPLRAMPVSPARPISSRISGCAMRKFMRVSRLCPPARTFRSSPWVCSAATASSWQSARRYLKAADFTGCA